MKATPQAAKFIKKFQNLLKKKLKKTKFRSKKLTIGVRKAEPLAKVKGKYFSSFFRNAFFIVNDSLNF
jgi:hypothetical protein